MSDPYDALLVDIGNTRVKWAKANQGDHSISVHSVNQLSQLLPLIAQVKKVLVASVGDIQSQRELEALCDQHAVPLVSVETQPETFGIRCAYEKYQTLGADRWLAVLGARALTELPVAVVDVGTAATCDFVVGDQHLGGWILPGLDLMKRALTSNTEKVFSSQVTPDEVRVGESTEDCVNYGCLAAIQGMVQMARERLARDYNEYRLIVCGGNQSLLQQQNDEKTIFVENMVIQGLARFI